MRIVTMAGRQKEKRMKINAQTKVPKPDKTDFNLNVDTALKKAIQIWCIENDTKPSIETERLWREFLDRDRGGTNSRVIKPK